MGTTNELQHEHARAMQIADDAITLCRERGMRSGAVLAQMIIENLDTAGLLRTPPLVEASVYDVEVEGGRFLQLTVLVDDAVEEKVTQAISVGLSEALSRRGMPNEGVYWAEIEADARTAALKWFYEGGWR